MSQRYLHCIAHLRQARSRTLDATTELDRTLATALAAYWERETKKATKGRQP